MTLHVLNNRISNHELSKSGWDRKENFKTVWTREEIEDLIRTKLGCYEIAVKGWEVFGLIYRMDKKAGKTGIIMPEEMRDDDCLNQNTLLLLDHGDAAFKDQERFPNGQEHFIGQWYQFDKLHGRRIPVNGHLCALLPDTSLRAHISNPDLIENIGLSVF